MTSLVAAIKYASRSNEDEQIAASALAAAAAGLFGLPCRRLSSQNAVRLINSGFWDAVREVWS